LLLISFMESSALRVASVEKSNPPRILDRTRSTSARAAMSMSLKGWASAISLKAICNERARFSAGAKRERGLPRFIGASMGVPPMSMSSVTARKIRLAAESSRAPSAV
jgi:hypothetical protein